MYGESLYGNTLYASNELSSEEIKPYIPDLMKYLPPWYRDSKIMVNIQNAIAIEIGKVRYSKDDLLKQFYIDSATWGLSEIWEQPLGIETDLNKSFEERREIVKAKLRGSGTVTKKMIKNTAEAFSNGECDVIEHNDQYYFTVKFIGVKGIPKNMNAFKKMLEDIKPAHLAYDFAYNCTVWDFIDFKNTWGQEETKNTWDSIRAY